jgi:hypothetical protein
MLTNLEKVIDDIKKRSPDQPLSLAELLQLKEIPYSDLIKEPQLVKLLVRYSKESRNIIYPREAKHQAARDRHPAQADRPDDVLGEQD